MSVRSCGALRLRCVFDVRSLRCAAGALCASLLCSCASISVKDVARSDAAKPNGKPERIYVVLFSVAQTKVKENMVRKNPGQLRFEAQQILAQRLAAELSKTIAPASVAPAGAPPPRAGWLVSGEITRISEGSRLLRMGIGLGLGGTKMETVVQVHNLPAPTAPFLRFSTTGGSNAEPGAATNPIPFSAAPTALLQTKGGVTDDAARTARMIAATIADYMVQRGWLAQGTAPKPKMLAQ
jgi:uncharacterized protein DUF4410